MIDGEIGWEFLVELIVEFIVSLTLYYFFIKRRKKDYDI